MEKLTISKSWELPKRSHFIPVFDSLEEGIQDAFISKDTKALAHYIKMGCAMSDGLKDAQKDADKGKEIANVDLLPLEMRYITGLIIMANSYAHNILNKRPMQSIEDQYKDYERF